MSLQAHSPQLPSAPKETPRSDTLVAHETADDDLERVGHCLQHEQIQCNEQIQRDEQIHRDLSSALTSLASSSSSSSSATSCDNPSRAQRELAESNAARAHTPTHTRGATARDEELLEATRQLLLLNSSSAESTPPTENALTRDASPSTHAHTYAHTHLHECCGGAGADVLHPCADVSRQHLSITNVWSEVRTSLDQHELAAEEDEEPLPEKDEV